jgi:hypothetical protein
LAAPASLNLNIKENKSVSKVGLNFLSAQGRHRSLLDTDRGHLRHQGNPGAAPGVLFMRAGSGDCSDMSA